MASNPTRLLRKFVSRVPCYLSFDLSLLCRREKPPILRSSAPHVHGDRDGFDSVYLGRSTDSMMDSDDGLSYTVPIVGLTLMLQSTR